eukprot:TRINITY_DN2351_c0_g1_i7.p1 TRINITY_DN2351_c0_g1~~TRINITY_DN2351_c0_g1_i7.p1  ORF type:complete len:249 (+),score=51.85 TRINITY_DN2351_c0_g1_i7:220-966(+)
MDKLFGFLKKEKVSSRSKLEIPSFTPAEIKEIQHNINTFQNREAKQYIINTLKKHKELETQFTDLQEFNRRQGSLDSPDIAKRVVVGGTGPSITKGASVEKVIIPASTSSETKATENVNTAPSGASTKPRPTGGSGGSFKRVDNTQVQTITKKESMSKVINLNARIDDSSPRMATTKEDINAALKELDPSYQKKEEEEEEQSDIGDGFSTVRIKPDEDDDVYGTVRVKPGGGWFRASQSRGLPLNISL